MLHPIPKTDTIKSHGTTLNNLQKKKNIAAEQSIHED